MQDRPPRAAPVQARSAFQVDRSKSTSTAAAYDPRHRSASVAESATHHRHGLGDALSRAANLLAPHRKKSTGPTPVDPLAGNNNTNQHHVISGSATASPALSPVPQLRALESYSARNVAAALDPALQTRSTDDVWQQVCIRVLPLFNGEGIRGFLEELNELVLTHVHRTFLRCQSSRPAFAPSNPSLNLSSLVTGLITADLTDLIRIGLVTLANKLSPADSTRGPISDEKLLARLNEIWLFFFTGVLPHLEGVFWVLRSDDRLRAAVGESEAGRTAGSDTSGTSYGAHGFADTRIDSRRIDVRRIALIEFRDCIVHPEMDRLVQIFASFDPYASSSRARPRASGFESQASTRPPSVSHNYSEASSSHPSFPNPLQRSPLNSTFPIGQPGPSQHRQHPSPCRLSPNPEHTASFEPRSPGMRSASGGSQFRVPRRTASHGSTPAFPRPFESSHADDGGPRRGDGMLASSPAEAQALARRRQMIAILASLLTADERQAEMDHLVRLLRPVYNARYRQFLGTTRAEEEEEEQVRRDRQRGNSESEEDEGERTYEETRNGTRKSADTTTVAAGADSSGVATSLTASPDMLAQDLRDAVPDLNPLPAPFPIHANGSRLAGGATILAETSRQISARQRSRTMNSLDEEQPDSYTYSFASRSPRLDNVPDREVPPQPPQQRHSIDVPRVASGGPVRVPSSSSLSQSLSGHKKTRRLSFRPWLGRSDSTATASSTSASMADAGSSTLALADNGGGDAAAAAAAAVGGATLTPGILEGDRLRRGLLRRNSSRRTSDLSAIVPQLGVGYGQLAGDPAADEEVGPAEDWHDRSS
ncbi:hypothetical protein JCM3774_005999 [Rhodotorula dairenensis]